MSQYHNTTKNKEKRTKDDFFLRALGSQMMQLPVERLAWGILHECVQVQGRVNVN